MRARGLDLAIGKDQDAVGLAMLAHELRGPLAPLRAAASILQSPAAGSDVVRRAHDIIERQVRSMSRLIDDLLDASRVTEGKVRLQLETVELAEIVARAVETQRAHIEARRQKLAIELPPRPIFLEADPVRLVRKRRECRKPRGPGEEGQDGERRDPGSR